MRKKAPLATNHQLIRMQDSDIENLTRDTTQYYGIQYSGKFSKSIHFFLFLQNNLLSQKLILIFVALPSSFCMRVYVILKP